MGSAPSRAAARGGFTLVELIAVMVVIGILAAMGTPQYRKTIERAWGAIAYSGLATLQRAERLYYLSAERYLTGQMPLSPEAQARLDINLPKIGWMFAITSTNVRTQFTVTAMRKSGPCLGATITQNEKSLLNEAEWRACIEALGSPPPPPPAQP